jgi:hypothetical protein
MLKIEKIKDKRIVKVAGQKNCTRSGYSYKYEGQGDCLNDCTNVNKPRYYKAKTH